ncbi:MAG: hypothetical protein ABMA00_03875 [Gemmatimonas sp.]
MFRMKALVATLATVALVAASSTLSAAPVRASAPSFDLLADGVFGCRLTISAKNESNGPVTIKLGESRSKNRGSPIWNRWNRESNWVINPTGNVQSNVVDLDLPCSAGDRRYEFEMSKAGTTKVIEFPANNDFTGDVTIGLGNVARHF